MIQGITPEDIRCRYDLEQIAAFSNASKEVRLNEFCERFGTIINQNLESNIKTYCNDKGSGYLTEFQLSCYREQLLKLKKLELETSHQDYSSLLEMKVDKEQKIRKEIIESEINNDDVIQENKGFSCLDSLKRFLSRR